MVDLNGLGKASVPAVKQYLALAKEQGLDLTFLSEELSLSRQILEDNDEHISGACFQHLLSRLIEMSDDALFGLHTAKFVEVGSYSVLGFIVMNCATLGEAINKIQPFEKLVGDMGVSQLQMQGEQMMMTWSCAFTDPLVKRHMIDNCLASWVTFAQYLIGDQVQPLSISLTREQPDADQCQAYVDVFQCPVYFQQSSNAIFFDKSLLTLPLNKGNKQLLPTLESHAHALLKQQSEQLVEQVRFHIAQGLSQGLISQQAIAKQMKMGSKTLQRRLKNEDVLFKSLLDEVRLSRSKALLMDVSSSLNHVSMQLGFAEPRSFFRWCQQQLGMTPGEYRKQLLGNGVAANS